MTISDFVAIDPLALLLPSSVYVKIIELIHPHVPKVAEIQAATKGMTAEEKAFVVARAENLAAHAKAVAEAIKSAN